MKKLILTLLALASLTASAQLTNGVKVSALSSATTPLAGTEILPLVQSGATKSATVDAVIFKATSSIATASNYFQLSFNTNFTRQTVASNYFQLFASTNAAAIVVSSNAAAASNAVLAANSFTTSNAIVSRIAGSNFLTSAQVASSNFQSGAQVTATVNSAITASGGVTNSGAANFATVSATNLNFLTPLATTHLLTANTNLFVDFAAGSFQEIAFTYSGAFAATVNFIPTNVVTGQQINLVVKQLTRQTTFTTTAAAAAGFKTFGTLTTGVVPSANIVNLNWLCVGTNLLFSASYSP